MNDLKLITNSLNKSKFKYSLKETGETTIIETFTKDGYKFCRYTFKNNKCINFEGIFFEKKQ
jgi:hypothetical protein